MDVWGVVVITTTPALANSVGVQVKNMACEDLKSVVDDEKDKMWKSNTKFSLSNFRKDNRLVLIEANPQYLFPIETESHCSWRDVNEQGVRLNGNNKIANL